MNKIGKTVKWIVIWLALFWWGTRFLDPDFGWHWKMGEMVVSKGIPKTDPFSYSMPSFEFIDHEWLFNVIIYWLDSKFGYYALAILVATITTITLGLIRIKFKRKNLRFWEEMFFVWSLIILVPFYGVRNQMVSWLFLAILMKFFYEEKIYEKNKFWLPIIMLIWTNLHGSFPMGLLVIGLIVINKLVVRKINRSDILIVILSTGVTLINPYGPRIWMEIYHQMSDIQLKWRIAEWFPSFFNFQIYFFCLAVLVTVLVYIYRKEISFKYLLLFGFLLIQAILSQRHIPLWLIVAFPLLGLSFDYFESQIKNIKGAAKKLEKAGKYGLKVFVILLIIGLSLSLIPSQKNNFTIDYPSRESINFLKNRKYQGEIFSKYDWGGFLIKNLSEKKVFIDGRMPSWQKNDSNPNESKDAMKDYLGILESESGFEMVFNKYPIEAVLWPVKGEKTIKLKLKGWIEVYRDKIAVIYEKKKE